MDYAAPDLVLRRSNRQARALLLGVGGTVVAIALGYGAAAWVVYGFEHALLNLAGAGALAALLLAVLVRPNYEITEPLSLVILAVAVGTTLKPAYVLFGPRESWEYFLLNEPSPLFFLDAASLIALAMAMLAIGYVSISPRSMFGRGRGTQAPWKGRRVLIVAGVATVISVIAMAGYVQKMGIQSIMDNVSGKRFYEVEGAEYASSALGYYRWAASLTQPALLVALAWALNRYRRIPTPVAVGLLVLGMTAVLFPFFNSSRTGIVVVLLEVFIVWRCIRGRLPKGVVLTFSVTVFALLLLATALRPKSVGVEDLDVSETLGVDLALDVTVGGRHFLDLTRTAHVLAGVPEKIRYQYGKTYLTWIVTPIPRTMWPEKPTLGSGPIIGPTIFGTGGSGVPPGMVGELYLNFGLVGLIIGPFLMGALLRFSYEQFRPMLVTPMGAVLYASVIIPLGWNGVTGDFSRMVVGVLTNLIPVLFAIWVVRVTRPARTRPVYRPDYAVS